MRFAVDGEFWPHGETAAYCKFDLETAGTKIKKISYPKYMDIEKYDFHILL